ncbi:hypothetical protein BCR36DRAFT_445676 [Piromyces finnis]|uniref:Uncharacterized protein n=1 Tax=Piromyces finnis TaxID=1754191 RepID=A0A1Y1UBU8_9FUNG|nr:hypothetical protein BCR36DRAFT_445676 [Piromyces finnis]|eukprot:ORX35520.1 hypothetical protein BCR36DRAFT_445676 [Piromyces finnis]
MHAWTDLHKIDDKKEIYEWCLLTVKGSGAKEIRRCITHGPNGKIYPDLETIRDILKNLYDLEYKPEDIIDDLNKYNQFESFDQNGITVADYLNAIKSRTELWKGVKLTGRWIKLNEAFKIAELYDKVDKKMKNKSTSKSSFGSSSRFNFVISAVTLVTSGHKKSSCPEYSKYECMKYQDMMSRSKHNNNFEEEHSSDSENDSLNY